MMGKDAAARCSRERIFHSMLACSSADTMGDISAVSASLPAAIAALYVTDPRTGR